MTLIAYLQGFDCCCLMDERLPSMRGLDRLSRMYPWPERRPDVPPSRHTWYNPANEAALRPFLSSETRLIAEVGAWLGYSARRMLALAPNARIICIDHWLGGPDHLTHPEFQHMLPTLYETFLSSCWELRERIIPLRAYSVIGLDLIHRLDLAPELIYIDGSHEYPDVVNDLETSLRLFPRAVIVGDDWSWPSVASAVSDVAGRRSETVGVNGVCWWIDPRTLRSGNAR